jgi:ubiquinone/menaquinone biosynthesis C-methylase UbiE
MGSSTTQGELWGIAARDWAELQEPLHTPVWEAMLNTAKVGYGTRFFDAGCGGGGASVLAAQRGAHISGLDASEALIAIARERVPEGDFRVGDLEALPYSEKAFDAVIAALSVQYAADPIAALRELKRVCAPEGYLVISTWGLPEYCEQRVVFKAVQDTLSSSPSGGGPFALSAAGALESLVKQAGWKVIGSYEVDCPFEYKDLETHWWAQRSGGPLQGAIRAAGEERLRSAVEQAVQPYRTPTGGVRLENRFRYVTATA